MKNGRQYTYETEKRERPAFYFFVAAHFYSFRFKSIESRLTGFRPKSFFVRDLCRFELNCPVHPYFPDLLKAARSMRTFFLFSPIFFYLYRRQKESACGDSAVPLVRPRNPFEAIKLNTLPTVCVQIVSLDKNVNCIIFFFFTIFLRIC